VVLFLVRLFLARVSAGDGAVLHALAGAQRADELRHVGQSIVAKVLGDAFIDGLAHQRVVEQGGADADRRRAGEMNSSASLVLVMPPWPMIGTP